MEFSHFLNTIYWKMVWKARIKRNRSGYEHEIRTYNEALSYLNTKFPLHYNKNRKILQSMEEFPKSCGDILIIDIGCGPLTFSQSFLDELLISSKKYFAPVYSVTIKGYDKSEEIITLGKKMLGKWKKRFKYLGWNLEYNDIIVEDYTQDNIVTQIANWVNGKDQRYIFIGLSAIVSSQFTALNQTVSSILDKIIDKVFCIILMVPNHYNLDQIQSDLDIIKNDYNMYVFKKIYELAECNVPHGMHTKYDKLISQNFQVCIVTNKAPFFSLLEDEFGSLNEFSQRALIYNKAVQWLKQQKFYDRITFSLCSLNYNLAFNLLFRNKEYKLPFKTWPYPIQKGLKEGDYQKVTLYPLPIIILSIIAIEKYGKKIESILDSYQKVDVIGTKLNTLSRWNWVYQYYQKDYQKFVEFQRKNRRDFNPLQKNIYLCKTDIIKYYLNIDLRVLFKALEDCFTDTPDDLARIMELFTYCIIYSDIMLRTKINQMPIGSVLSPLCANYYLNFFDYRMESSTEVKKFIRYMDDMKIIIEIDDNTNAGNIVKEFLKDNIIINDIVIDEPKPLCFHLDDIKFNFNLLHNIVNNDELQQIDEFNKLTKSFDDLWRCFLNGLAEFWIEQEDQSRALIIENFKEFTEILEDFFSTLNVAIDAEKIQLLVWFLKSKIEISRIQVESFSFSSITVPIVIDAESGRFNIIEKENWLEIENNNDWNRSRQSFAESIYLRIVAVLNNISSLSSESEKFAISMRNLRYYVYKIARLKYEELFNSENEVINQLFELRKQSFPIRLLGNLFLQYNHLDLIIKMIDEGLEHLAIHEVPVKRIVYPCDIAGLLDFLSLFYKKDKIRLKKNSEKFLSWIEKIMKNGDDFERNAILTFVIDLKLYKYVKTKRWLNWIKGCDDILVLKNLLLCYCLKSNINKSNLEIKKKILMKYKEDEFLTNLVQEIIPYIRKGELDLEQQTPIINYVHNFNDIINLDLELQSLFDWEDFSYSNEIS